MEFRPCIDIHNGKVKQIVGGSLLDEGNRAKENFVAEQDAFFCEVVPEQGLKGGHIILLNPVGSSIMKRQKHRQNLHCRHIRWFSIGGRSRQRMRRDFRPWCKSCDRNFLCI